jgi:aspartate/methionine/tyrosine aminotransferase
MNNNNLQKKKKLCLENISEKVKSAEYAVRGELVIHAEKLNKELLKQKETNQSLLPFNEIVYCNIGNPQSLGQKPLTFFRQYLALVEYPEMIKNTHIQQIFPKDVICRAENALKKIPGGLGAYSHSQGLPFVRESVSKFISERDSTEPPSIDNIFLHNGASPAVQDVLRILIRNEKDGIMIPIPQYPLYSASIKLLGGTQVGYYLQEEKDWGLSINELERSINDASNRGIEVRALVIINPGNPTGQVLTVENMKEVIQFCYNHQIVLMADEVYQENVYIKEERSFHSFKKILMNMEPKYKNLELFSFNSISKGFMGECGHRGGYVECTNIDEEVKTQLYKCASVLLCPNTAGQILMEVMVNPPKLGDESYELYIKERDDIYNSLKRRAIKLTKFLDSLEGISCNRSQGAMYAFPQIKLPLKAIEAAKAAGKKPDDFYCLQLLDKTGVCVVPGSGFGQKDGTYHFRTTFLPPENKIDLVMDKLSKFHSEFLKLYK